MSVMLTIRFRYVANGRNTVANDIIFYEETAMWKALRAYGPKAGLANNGHLRALARTGSEHLFEDIGLNRNAFVNLTDEQIRSRAWWYQ